jgi:DNA-binding MarR family transcriptional regulator
MRGPREGGFLIAKVHHVAGRIFARLLKDHGIEEISPPLGRILFVLWQEDGIAIGELAKRTSLEKSTLTTLLDRLEASGFVERVRSREDRRVILVRRTTKDKTWQKTYEEVSEKMNRLFYAGLSAQEIDRFEETLRRLLANLTILETGHRRSAKPSRKEGARRGKDEPAARLGREPLSTKGSPLPTLR